ncbi:MAG: hypothetical protein ACR2OZ_09090 [Verrucomicrobiales bacterium]
MTRRRFLGSAAGGWGASRLVGQEPGARPPRAQDITVVNPRARVPVSLIVDDSTCLVNLNKFAIPQFAQVFPDGQYDHYDWRSWPNEIPDGFVRKFGEWASAAGVKGKYSIVPFPACVGRLDRTLPGWTQKELESSLELVRTHMMPNWDIHPEMVTHTRVIDTKIGHPTPEFSRRFMENWDWTTGRSADEIADYMHYALTILKNVGLPCEGVTTPGGFGNRARPQLAQAAFQSCRDVFKTEIPHYFRDLFDRGEQSVAPRVEYANGLDGDDPQCVVSILGCTGDWTGGWDCTEPGGTDKFISADGTSGRMVEVIRRGQPAIIVCHWTGIYFNGQEIGLKILQEVAQRLAATFDHLLWMKVSEIARYWAARELTSIEIMTAGGRIGFRAPFACPDFTVEVPGPAVPTQLRTAETALVLKEVADPRKLAAGTWSRLKDRLLICFPLPKGTSTLEFV